LLIAPYIFIALGVAKQTKIKRKLFRFFMSGMLFAEFAVLLHF
jgi:hypothetical protein